MFSDVSCLWQRQAHSAGLFFFRCTLCNSKDSFQAEMLRMGIFIPERYGLHPRAGNPLQHSVYVAVSLQRCILGVGGRRLFGAPGGLQTL